METLYDLNLPTFHQDDKQLYVMGGFKIIDITFVQLYIQCTKKCGVMNHKEVQPQKLFKNYIIYQILQSLKSSRGQSFCCTAEFGVFKGVTSMLMTTILNNPKDQHYIFDSFEGLSKPTLEDIEGSVGPVQGGEMSPDYDHIQNLFPESHLQKCWIPSELMRVETLFDFVHIDLDLYVPILGALDYLLDKSNPGCIIIVDDYNTKFPGCIKAISEHISKYKNLYRFHYDTMEGSYILIRK